MRKRCLSPWGSWEFPNESPNVSTETEVRPPFHSRDPGVSRFAPEKITTFHPTQKLQWIWLFATLIFLHFHKNQHQQTSNKQHQTSNWICWKPTVITPGHPEYPRMTWVSHGLPSTSQNPTNRRQFLEAIILGASPSRKWAWYSQISPVFFMVYIPKWSFR